MFVVGLVPSVEVTCTCTAVEYQLGLHYDVREAQVLRLGGLWPPNPKAEVLNPFPP